MTLSCDAISSKYKFKGNWLTNGYNGGYYVFETLKELTDHKELLRLQRLIEQDCRSFSGSKLSKLNLDDITKIAEIMGIE